MCGDSRSPALGDYPQHLGADSFRSFGCSVSYPSKLK